MKRRRKLLSIGRVYAICLLAALFCTVVFYVHFDGQANTDELADDNVVFAIPSDDKRYILAEASRPSRQGFRAVIATNSTSLGGAIASKAQAWRETWLFHPDDEPLLGKYPGDSRAALVPFLAYESLGDTFDWLLYGDDDTLWFLENVRQLTSGLDASMPYFLTDNIWWSAINGTIGSHPHTEAPRCLPCNKSFKGSKRDQRMGFNAPIGCPCTPQLLCQADAKGVFDAQCSIPLHQSPTYSSRTYSMHGGAGAILSIGLLRTVSTEQMKECISQHGPSTGGDAFITICLWKMGFATTDPGVFLDRLGVSAFGGVEQMKGASITSVFEQAMQDECTSDDFVCKELLPKLTTFHISSRTEGSLSMAAASMQKLDKVSKRYFAARKAHIS